MRGYGESDKPPGRQHYVIPALASDAAALVKALGHEKCAPELGSCCPPLRLSQKSSFQEPSMCMRRWQERRTALIRWQCHAACTSGECMCSDLGSCTAAAAEQLRKWRRCTLLGHDWGSMVAWLTCARIVADTECGSCRAAAHMRMQVHAAGPRLGLHGGVVHGRAAPRSCGAPRHHGAAAPAELARQHGPESAAQVPVLAAPVPHLQHADPASLSACTSGGCACMQDKHGHWPAAQAHACRIGAVFSRS
jgi:hypothetical protein